MLPYYVLAGLLAALAGGVGFKAGRYYPHASISLWFHHEPNVFDWLRRPV
jgi:hypothetical protein